MRNDEAYILNICDYVLQSTRSRQHRFDFLRGDSRTNRRGRNLPVDVYYEHLNLVIEYHERQHFEPVPFFDNRITCSGVTRGEQRRIYDQRRRTILPQFEIEIVEFAFSNFTCHANGRLVRNELDDETIIRNRLEQYCRNG